MKKKKYIYSLVIILLCSACKKNDLSNLECFSFDYYPRECTQIITLPMQDKQSIFTVNEKLFSFNKIEAIDDDGVDAKQYVLWLMTGADDLEEMRKDFPNIKDRAYEGIYNHSHNDKYHCLSSPILELEKQLYNDYKNGISTGVTNTRGEAMNLMPWEYRITGIKDFNIIALSSLFGQPAGTSLNRFFIIDSFEPKQIISYQTKNLLWGYSDINKVENLQQWLNMRPMAPPVVMFKFKTLPQEVPKEVKFVSILETTDDKILYDTLQVYLK